MSILKKYEFILKNLDCANCANKIQNKIAENKDYKNVNVNFNTLKLTFTSELEEAIVMKNIKEIISKLEPEVEVLNNNQEKKSEKNVINIHIARLLIGIACMGIAILGNFSEIYKNILIIIAYVVLLSRTAINAVKLLAKKTINESFLITISCIGAYIIGEIFEGLMVIVLYEIGKILEEKAVNKTRKSISVLMDIRPEYANLKHGNHEHKVSPEEVKIGDIIVIKTGEKVPLDGIVIKGNAKINTSSLTGESKLSVVNENDKILSGSINEAGIIEVKVTEKYENSTVNKILELVENATDKKAKTETFVNKAARIYTPIVIVLAILVAIILPLITNITYRESIYRALIFLVVSCPCAIAISVPLSYFSGIGRASKYGILIKGSDYLDALGHINYIVFDKTGTLTKGEFGIQNIVKISNNYSENDILEYIVLGESFSNHPISKSILKYYNKPVDNSKISNFKEISGKGLEYELEDKVIKIGNAELVETEKVNEIGTVIFIKVNDEIIGYLVLSDNIKSEAKKMIQNLKKLSIKAKMFTGDNEKIALEVGKELGIDEIKCEMLPTEKYSELEKILEENKNTMHKVAFVGDGINDSPVLARADIGISMGGVGASSAIEASDVVIMTDNLEKIEEAIKISKKTDFIIKQNLIFAIGVKGLVLILSALGISQMWQAVFADVGVTLITIFNTLRILKYKAK